MDDMEIVRYKFTCCACYKTFVVKSGGSTRYVNCPYCGEQNRINTGEHAQYVHKAPVQQPEKEPTYPRRKEAKGPLPGRAGPVPRVGRTVAPGERHTV